MKTMPLSHRYIKKTPIKTSVERLADYHAGMGAVERLTPPWVPVRVVSRTGTGIHTGTRIKFHLGGSRMFLTWESEHVEYEENSFFTDVQIRGPFTHWKHIHRFLPCKDSFAVMEDEVHFSLPGGTLAWPFYSFVFKQLDRVFAYRHRILKHDLETANMGDSMRILVAGASGVIGSALVPFLRMQGHEVIRLVRDKKLLAPDCIFWDPYRKIMDLENLESFDAVVSLNGVDIAGKRWSSHRKRQIMDSRCITTQFLARSLVQLSRPPKVWLCASAIGYYSGSQPQKSGQAADETGSLGTGFLAQVCNEWEIASAAAQKAGIRVVNMRTGVVLTPAGGALAKMVVPFQTGLGAVISPGNQYMSWISIEDMIRAILHCIQTPSLKGPINMTAPNPATNKEFSRSLGRVYYPGHSFGPGAIRLYFFIP